MEGTAEEIVKWLFSQDREKIFEIKEKKRRRSLNANAYAWLLIGKLADVLRISKDECYILMLKRYGQSEMVSVVSEIDVRGYFKYYEAVGTTFLQEKNFTHYRVFKGSSEYDTREMSILVDGIVSECHEVGIETMTPSELEKLKSLWRAS